MRITLHIGKFTVTIIVRSNYRHYACYEQTSFYDTQMKAIQEASGRTEKTLTHLCGLLTDLITAGSICALVCLISPIFLVLSLLPLIAQTLWGGKLGEIRSFCIAYAIHIVV